MVISKDIIAEHRELLKEHKEMLLESLEDIEKRKNIIEAAGDIPEEKREAADAYIARTEELEFIAKRLKRFLYLSWICSNTADAMLVDRFHSIIHAATVFREKASEIVSETGAIDTEQQTKFNKLFQELWISLTKNTLRSTK